MVRMVDARPTPTFHVLRGRAGEVEPALVVPVNVAGALRHPGELTDVVRKFAKAFFARAELFFDALALADVDAGGDQMCDAAALVAQRGEFEILR